MSGRDPLYNPRPGDHVRKLVRNESVERQVVYVTVGGTVVYDVAYACHGQLTCSLSAWRRWAKGGTPRLVSGNYMLSATDEVRVGFWTRGQINGLANRCKPERSSTPYDATLLALLELGLEAALTDYKVEGRLREILKKRVEGVT